MSAMLTGGVGEALGAKPAGPPTGRAYLASLDDGREVWSHGRRVGRVTEEEGFRNAARSIARLYDALHADGSRRVLACATDTGSGTITHRFFRVSRGREELMAARGAIEAWARLTGGWMGRTPDYKASLTTTFGACPGFYGPFEANARRWYARAQEEVTFLSHAVANPPVDRDRPMAEVGDVIVTAQRETGAGVIVSGVKVVATGAPLTRACYFGQTPGTISDDPAQALAFIVPLNAPGVRVIARASYERAAGRTGTPFDYPLASRFDENDAVVVLDRVLVKWEDVLIYRDAERARRFFFETGFVNNFLFHGCTRLAVKLEFLAALMARGLKLAGHDRHRGPRALLGEVIAWGHTVRALSEAMASMAEPWGEGAGAVLPQRRAALAYCLLGPECVPRVRAIVQQTLGSGLIYLPSGSADLLSEELRGDVGRFYRGPRGRDGEAGVDARERIKVMKLLWDAVGSEFAGRHELYERNYAGSWESLRLMIAGEAEEAGRLRAGDDLVDACLNGYDEQGWTDAAWAEGPGRGAGGSR